MRKKASGFYADSLEMLLDTMCNVLGGIIFITLTLAVLTRNSSTPESNQSQAAQLTSELASVTSSNAVVDAGIQSALLQLQAQSPPLVTNRMRLPNLSGTTNKPWNVIVRYGRVYPLYLLAPAGRAPLKNSRTLDWRGAYVEPQPGRGDDPEGAVADMARAFRSSAQTNYYFAFWVYEDSFAAFNRAKEVVFNQGMQYGWEPMAENARLALTGRGPGILPQD